MVYWQNKMKSKKRKTIWRIWAKSLGEKGSKCDREADIIAIVRTFIFFTYLTTNIAIIANAVRHWNDIEYSNSIEKLK